MTSLFAGSGRTMVFLFVAVAIVHALGPSTQVTDSRLSVPTAVSLLREQNFDLDEFETVQELQNRYDIVEVRGHKVMGYPYAPALFALPLVAIAEALPGIDPGDLSVSDPNRTWLIEVPTASVLTAASSVLFFLVAEQLLTGSPRRRRKLALLSAFVFAFATPVWSTASRALWQHTPSILLLTLGLLLCVRSRRVPSAVSWLGVVLAASFAMRPTNAIPLAVLSLWVLVSRRQYAFRFLLGGVTTAAAFVALNLLVYDAALPPYFEPGKLEGTTTFVEALVGTLVAPSRGLLLYTPILVLVPVGVWLRVRDRRFDSLDAAVATTVVLHWVLISSWANWWGGSSFGPRLFADMVPFLAYFVLPVIDRLPLWVARRDARARILAIGCAVVVAASVLVHVQGAYVRATFCWNATPEFIDDAPDRNWTWSDPQVLRGISDLSSGDRIRTVIAGSCTTD